MTDFARARRSESLAPGLIEGLLRRLGHTGSGRGMDVCGEKPGMCMGKRRSNEKRQRDSKQRVIFLMSHFSFTRIGQMSGLEPQCLNGSSHLA